MPHRPPHGSSLILLTLGLSLGTFMQVLDSSIANVSLPHISGDLAVSPNQGTWVITSFGVSNAIALPLTGWLTRRFGDVRLFVASTLLFTLASWLCGLAPSLPLLIAARVLQGAVAGPMIPLSQSLLLANYPPEKKGLALALWSTTVIVAPILGPILGGWITDNISWPWIFYINLPFGLLSAFLTWTLLGRRSSATRSVPIDKVGLFLLVVGVGALQILLDKGNDLDWFESQVIVVLAVVAVACLAVLVVWELTDRHPVVDLHLFAERNFLVGTIILSIGYLVFFGNVVILPLWLQTNMGYTATWAGYAAAFQGVLAVVMSPIVASQVAKRDPRALVSFGIFWMAGIAIWRTHFNTGADFTSIILPQLFLGFAMPFFFIPTQSISLSSVDPEETAAAAGVANFLRVVAGAFATSIMTTAWENDASAKRNEMVGVLNRPNATLDAMTAQGFTPDQALRQLEGLVQSQAVMLSTNTMYMATAVVFAVAATTIWLAPRPKRTAAPGGGH